MKITLDRDAIERLLIDSARLAAGVAVSGPSYAPKPSRYNGVVTWSEDGSATVKLLQRKRKRKRTESMQVGSEMPPMTSEEVEDMLSQVEDLDNDDS